MVTLVAAPRRDPNTYVPSVKWLGLYFKTTDVFPEVNPMLWNLLVLRTRSHNHKNRQKNVQPDWDLACFIYSPVYNNILFGNMSMMTDSDSDSRNVYSGNLHGYIDMIMIRGINISISYTGVCPAEDAIIKAASIHQYPLLLTWFNFDLSMEK